MIVLDTNVVSELMRREPARPVLRFVSVHAAASLFTTTVTQAEIRYGLMLLPHGRRREALEAAASGMFAEDFAERVLPFDGAAADAYAAVAAERRRAGRPIAVLDAQIAAIVRSRDATLATRNASDFEGCGIDVVNPWTGVAR